MRDVTARARTGQAILGAAATLLLALPLGAQEAAEEPGDTLPVLTLEEAFRLAERHNPGYRKARNAVELRGAGTREAWGSFLPTLRADASVGKGFSRSVRTEDFFGNPIDNPRVETVWNSSTSQSLSSSLTLFDGGRRFHQLGLARAEERAAELDARTRLTVVRADLEEAYRQAQKEAELTRVEEELLEARRRDLDATERGFRTASVSRVDVLTARLEVTRQEKRVEDARSRAARSLLALRRLVGSPALDGFRVAEEPPALFDPGAVAADSLVRTALRRNPEVRGLEATVDAREAAVSVAGTERWPRLAFSASVRRSEFGRNNDALFLLDPANQGGSFGLSISLPLFQGFSTGAAITRAEVNRENAREDLRAKELEVEELVRSRLLDLRNAYRGAEISERALEIARERLRLARERYRLGLIDFLDLQQVVSAAAEAERGALEARYGFAVARTALERVVGTAVAPPDGEG